MPDEAKDARIESIARTREKYVDPATLRAWDEERKRRAQMPPVQFLTREEWDKGQDTDDDEVADRRQHGDSRDRSGQVTPTAARLFLGSRASLGAP